MGWREDAEESQFIRLDEGLWVNIVVDMKSIEKGLNQFNRPCWDFQTVPLAGEESQIFRITARGLLKQLSRAVPEAILYAEIKVRRSGRGKEDTRYDLEYVGSRPDLVPGQKPLWTETST